MRTAIVHYWLLNHRGGEKVLEALCGMFPDADIYTLFYDPGKVSPEIRRHRVTASFLNPLRRFYRSLLPLAPLALEAFDLREYDLVISSESGPAKGVLTASRARHICYCHSPMRYLWELYPDYLRGSGPLKRLLMAPAAQYLRVWDYSTAARVDEFAANSENVRQRIWHVYRREAEVIYPPVAVESFFWKAPEDYYLFVGELVSYKRADLAVEAFSRNGRRLLVVGDGPEYGRLRRGAAANITFCGHVPDEELRELYARSRCLVVPGEEDFGMNAVEALASGKPVLAYARGGALETVPTARPFGGILFALPDADSLNDALRRLERSTVNPAELQAFAARFNLRAFVDKMTRFCRLPGNQARGEAVK